MEAELIRRKCDWCDTQQEFNKHSASFTAAERVQAEGWIVLVKVLFALGQIFPVQKHACRMSCAKNILELQSFELPDHVKAAVEQERKRLAMEAETVKNGVQFAGVAAGVSVGEA